MSSFRCFVRLAVFAGLLLSASALQAAPWAVVADSPKSRIGVLDFGTTPATVYGPFVTNQLGSEGGAIFDVAITPDGQTALISNFGDSTVYRLNISNPTNPVVTGCVTNSFFAEDIAITPDGRTAIVTDGGFSTKMGIIDLASFSTSLTYSITSGSAQAVAIAPDNQTVIVCDYFGRKIICGILCPTGLVSESVLSTGLNNPVNVAIAPDGKTVLLANAHTNEVNVFQISSPGNIVTGATPTVGGLVPGLGMQSIAFTRAGDRAYVLQNGNKTNMLSWLKINGPGNVTLGGAGVATLLAKSSSQLFGVDTLAVSPDGKWVLAGNPTLSGGTNMLAVVDASTFAVTALDASLRLPTGVAFVPMPGFNTVWNDFDGDRKSDLGFYRAGYWSIYLMAGSVLCDNAGPWGGANAIPVPGDFDGDGETDLAFYRAGYWSIYTMAGSVLCDNAGPWGGANAIPVPGDFDGDGKSDLAFYRNGYWSIYLMSGSVLCDNAGPWGGANAIPVPGDFDGDGKSDLAFYRNGYWSIYLMAGSVLCENAGPWGGATAIPVSGDFDGDGKTDLAYYRNGYWSIYLMSGSVFCYESGPWGGANAIPAPGDFDGDGKTDLAYYRAGYWSIYTMAGGLMCYESGPWGGANAIPLH
ncbi:MAG: FG-GAP-like repeat-containing protein [Kiritimatiellia bacterium]|jgi:DNA-binding beta-propeller fold protein YncE